MCPGLDKVGPSAMQKWKSTFGDGRAMWGSNPTYLHDERARRPAHVALAPRVQTQQVAVAAAVRHRSRLCGSRQHHLRVSSTPSQHPYVTGPTVPGYVLTLSLDWISVHARK